MKGIILAGGSGTRLYPITKSISKQILPIYDKPMIYYPLSTLMLAGIREILIISTQRDLPFYQQLLEDGSSYGLSISYKIQKQPNGIAESFIIGEDFIGKDEVCLILGDNIFYGRGFSSVLQKSASLTEGAEIFGYYVKNPTDFGVVEYDENYKVIGLEEKPINPKSNYAIPGLYFYDNNVIEIAKKIKPSKRGELEITSVTDQYLKMKKLKVNILGRGMSWLDTGTHEGLIDASNFVHTVQKRVGLYISCIEEIAFRMGYISKKDLLTLAKPLLKTDYGEYLVKIANEK